MNAEQIIAIGLLIVLIVSAIAMILMYPLHSLIAFQYFVKLRSNLILALKRGVSSTSLFVPSLSYKRLRGHLMTPSYYKNII